MRFRLRTLLILLAVLPPALAGGYFAWVKFANWREHELLKQEMRNQWERDHPGATLEP